MMRSRRGFVVLLGCLVASPGCGAPADQGRTSPARPAEARRVHFVGFDCSEPLLHALRAGKIEGLVVQNPLKMGELAVKAVVARLEKKEVEPVTDTGVTLVTPENVSEPEIARLVNPPKEEGGGGGTLSSSKTKRWRVFMIPKGTTHEHWKAVHYGAKKAAEELGNVELIWQGPQKEDDRVQQIQLVQNAIAAGVDGIALAPLDSRALARPVEQAVARGIPVVVFDSALESKAPSSYVATDNDKGGVLAARRLGELLKGKGKIILLRYMVGSASTDEREKGFTTTLAKEFPGVTYLSDTEYAGATSDTAQQKGQTLVTKYRGRIDGIFCPNESSTLGMLRALEGAGLLNSAPAAPAAAP